MQPICFSGEVWGCVHDLCKRIETPTMFVEEVGLFVCPSKSDDTSW
jgi:hypothetical protein